MSKPGFNVYFSCLMEFLNSACLAVVTNMFVIYFWEEDLVIVS